MKKIVISVMTSFKNFKRDASAADENKARKATLTIIANMFSDADCLKITRNVYRIMDEDCYQRLSY